MVALSSLGGAGWQFFDSNGTPLAGGKLYTYAAGTTTPAVTYTTSAGTPGTENTNPIILDSAGRVTAQVWLENADSYKFALETSTGVPLWTKDNIPGIFADIILTASAVEYDPPFMGAVTSGYTVAEKLAQTVSVMDFGAVGDGVANDTVAFQSAVDSGAASVYVPGVAAYYRVTNDITVPDNVKVYGDGWDSYVQQVTLNKDVFIAGNNNTYSCLRLKVADGNDTDFVNCIYAANVCNLTVVDNFLTPGDLGGVGVHIRGVKNSLVRGNRIFGGKWTAGSGTAAVAADILLYSLSASERHIIEGNFCLSNNSQGIFVDAIGQDGDILVADNICVTLDPATCTATGTWSLIASGGNRRHGIVIGYVSSSVSGSRAVVSGNICRNTLWTGIYKPGVSSGSVIISNNLCDLNGYAVGQALTGGIFLAQSGYELVIGNTITNYQNTTTGDTGAITVVNAAGGLFSSEIRNNKIVGSAGYGIVLNTKATKVTIDGNTITGCTSSDIFWTPTPGIATLGGHCITNNVIDRTTGTFAASIDLRFEASTLYTLVKNNVLRGYDNTTNNIANVAVSRSGANAYMQLIGNEISNFYFGVTGSAYWTGGRLSDVQFEGNVLRDCNTGFALGALDAAQTVPLTDNRFINVTTLSAIALGGSVAGRIVTRQGENFITQTTASPTLGSWGVGDQSFNSAPVVGQPKGWFCTVAGAPGTWVSTGNL
jgi:hypothetical protein